MPEASLMKILPGFLVSKSGLASGHPLFFLKHTLSFLAEDLLLHHVSIL